MQVRNDCARILNLYFLQCKEIDELLLLMKGERETERERERGREREREREREECEYLERQK